MYSAATISWLGFLVHNVADLPGQTLLSPETLWPSLTTAALLVVYSTGPQPTETSTQFQVDPIRYSEHMQKMVNR